MNRRLQIPAAAAAVLLASAAPAGAHRQNTIAAGDLTATAYSDPWKLTFSDADGRRVLTERGATGTEPAGTVGFRRAGLWFHATRVLDERHEPNAYVASLATSDPAGGRLTVRIARDSDGAIAVTALAPPGVEATGIGFEARADERYLGFGERSNGVDQRGNVVESYVAEGPYQPVERPFIAGFVPLPGYRPRDDATYFPIPWLLSTRGYGFLVDDDATSRYRLASDRADAWSVEVDGGRLRFRVFAGPEPADALRRMTARLGRQPPAAAPFFFGPWFQPTGGDEANIAALRRADAPASVAQTYTHYLPCGDHQSTRAEQRARTARLHAAGLAVTTYFNPMICTSYQPRFDEAVAAGVLHRNALGEPYLYRYTGSSQFFVGQFDFTAPGATAFYGRLLDEAIADGYDGWMEDFGEYTPTDARSADGTPGTDMHNRYPVLYHRAANEFSKRAPRPLARFNRSGWTGAARESQIVWGGDPTTGWGFDGLESAVYNGLTMGLSGVSLWGSAVGGFFALSQPQTTPELLVRWLQFGFASGVMRTEANGFDIPGRGTRAQIFDAGVLPHWRRYAKLRTQLYPYLAAAQREYDRTGLPLMRHLALAYPNDPKAAGRSDQYLLGPDLLVAPVVAPAARTRRLYLPRGRWIDLWRSVEVGSDGALALRAPVVLEGGREVTVPAPLEEIPLFVRAGAALTLLPADVQTLADYGDGVVHLRDGRNRRALLAWAGAGRERWRARLEGGRRRIYSVQAALAFRPCRLTVGGRRVARRSWSYSRTTGVLRARVRPRSRMLTATRRCRTRARARR